MNQPTDPAFGIKDALDREVRRRLDADRLCAALENESRSATAPAPLRETYRGRGPLSRVPPVVQWIGVAAAVIAAATGLRSLYLDLTAAPPPPPFEERASAETVRTPDAESSIVGVQEDKEDKEDKANTPSEPAHESEPVVALPAAPVVAAQRTLPAEPEVPEESTIAPSAGSEIAEASPPAATRTPLRPQPIPVAQPRTPARVQPESPPVRGTTPDRIPASPSPGSTTATFPGVVDTGAPGVREASFRLGGLRLAAKVTENPSLGATLVTLEPSRELRVQPDRLPQTRGEQPAPPPESVAPSSSYYVRVLVGSDFEFLPEEKHAWLGSGAEVVPLRGGALFGNPRQRAVLEEIFDLRSVVAVDGVRIRAKQDTAEAVLVAMAAGRAYALSVKGTFAPAEGGHRLELGISRKSSGRDTRIASSIEASVVVREDRVALIAVPDSLLGQDFSSEPASGDMMFVAVSPRSTRFEDALRRAERRIVERPGDPPILVDGGQADYPFEAEPFGAHGTVILRALVREDGTVDAIQVVDAPSVEGVEYLVEAAVSAVRTWRYIPARDRGRQVATYVDVTLEF